MTHFADRLAAWNTQTHEIHTLRENALRLGLSLAVAAAQALVPDATAVHFESSDQGEWLSFNHIAAPSGDLDYDFFNATSEYEAIEDFAQWLTWDQANHCDVPGWVVIDRRRGLYRLDIAEFLK